MSEIRLENQKLLNVESSLAFEIDRTIKHICVNGFKHKRIRNWFSCFSNSNPCLDYEWKKAYLSYGNVCFLVYYTKEHPKYMYVIRPAKHYYKIEFEQLFRFGLKNRGYREDRMIGLNKAD
uniref:Uncharacterized protein n=1 Tax=viral metagenome TaxID=1070528 RepID=A0A6C0JFY1_9ZZZZ